MTNKTTKRALFTSVMSLFLCFTMLLGTTYAWFTDSVSSANNVITAGNLDVELEYAKVVDGNVTAWESVADKQIFDPKALWEPGRVEVVYLKVSNLGTLALKYQLGVNVYNEVVGKTADGKDVKLSEHLVFTVVEEKDLAKNADGSLKPYTDREAVAAAAGTTKGLKDYNGTTTALDAKGGANDVDYVALIVYMPESVGNEANYRGDKVPAITLGVNLYATQYAAESDSFGKDYDKDAWNDGFKVYDAADLQAALNNGVTNIKLMNSIDLSAPIVIPAAATKKLSTKAAPANTVKLDLNGNTINAGLAEGSTTNHVYAFENHGSLLITGNGTINARGIFNYGTLILENGTINAIDGNGGYGVRNYEGAALIMNGGTIATTYEDDHKVDAGGYDATAVRVDAGATFEMNGGELKNICDFTFALDNYGTATINAGKLTSVHSTVGNYGTLTVNGGEITCNGLDGVTAHALWVNAGTVTINGGTFDGKDNNNGYNVFAYAGTVVNIYGGSFLPVHSGSLYSEGTITVYGGTFANEISKDYVAENYKLEKVAEATWQVMSSDRNYVADGVLLNDDGAYEIYSAAGLTWLATVVNSGELTFSGKTVRLMNDVDLNNAEWTPIGYTNGFYGVFDGQNYTVFNLKITGNKSTVGLFGNTYSGEIKNLTVENASVSGYLNVGVVAGNPYTAKYTNITVQGHIEVNGFAYVGGVGGKNAYANWTDITVNADDTSYVKAISTSNGVSYRTYVGGVVGFNGEGGHTFKNITTNIDVIGDVCDIGGVFGIAHYNNKFENITCTGNVTGLLFDPAYPEDAEEIGGIAGVWHNENGTSVTFTNCVFTGKINPPDPSVDVSNNTIVGKPYSATKTGILIINGVECVATLASLQAKLDAATGDFTVGLAADMKGDLTIVQKPDVKLTINGNGFTFSGAITINGKSARYDTAALTIQNLKFNAESISADAYINLGKEGDNNTRYTNNVTVKNCVFSGINDASVAIKSYTGGDWNLTVEGCVANSGVHSLLQVTNVEKNLKVIDCEAYSKNGMNLNNTPSLEMSGCTFDVKGYAIRFGVAGDPTAEQKTFNITNSTLKSACAANDDAVIVFRDNATNAKLTLTNTTLEGSVEFLGNTDATIIEKK